MTYCLIEVKTQTATFRNPEFQNFHKSFALPPPTTIIGLSGAALGLSPKEAQDYFEDKNFKMGVIGFSKGKAKDLWKYRTLDPKKPSSILTREILYDNSILIAFGNTDTDLIDALKAAFEIPQYAPTLGSSDSLAKLKVVDNQQITECSSRELSHCLVAGNVVAETINAAQFGDDFSLSYHESMIYDLPIRFQYESNYGVRRVIARKEFTFVGSPMLTVKDYEGLRFQEHFIPLFSI